MDNRRPKSIKGTKTRSTFNSVKRFFHLPSDNSQVIKEGYLQLFEPERVFVLREWQRQWFVFVDGCLYGYKDRENRTLTCAIPIYGCKLIRSVKNENQGENVNVIEQHVYSFKLVTSDHEVYIFSAYTVHEMYEWLEILDSYRQRLETSPEINEKCSEVYDDNQLNLLAVLSNDVYKQLFQV